MCSSGQAIQSPDLHNLPNERQQVFLADECALVQERGMDTVCFSATLLYAQTEEENSDGLWNRKTERRLRVGG